MSEWPLVALGEVTSQSRDAVKVGREVKYPLLGVRWYAQGAFHRETVTPKASMVYRVRPAQFIYNRLFAWKGSFGLVTEDLAGSFVSNEFPLFDCDPDRLMPEYLAYLFGRPAVWAEIERMSTGTTASRNRWNEPAFNAYTVPLPSLLEQRRIVSVMRAVEMQMTALKTEVGHSWVLYRAWLRSLEDRYQTRSIGSVLVRATAGGTPSRDHPEYFGGEIPWIKSGEVDNDGIADSSECITEAGLAASSARWVEPGATLVAMYGQGDTKGRAGFVVSPVTTNQAVLALWPDRQLIFDRYLLHAVRSRTESLRSRAVGAAQPNLSKALVVSEEIPVPSSLDVQRVETEGLDALVQLAHSVTAELEALRVMRTDLLTALLSQEITVDEAVDQFVKVA